MHSKIQNIHANSQAGRHTDWQTGRMADIYANIQEGQQAGTHAYKQTYRRA